ncbi:MAG: DUF2169 domain-containing protein [Sulfurifustis sp.]
MKIIKPLTLGCLQKPYRYRGRNYYVVTALGFFRLGENVERFLTEQSQWPVALKALPAGEPIDFAMPKAHGEMLLAGSAYALGSEPVTRMIVRASVGTIDKCVTVVGDREWMYGIVPFYRVTDPSPFRVMPLGYERAYGGPNHPANPRGVGYTGRRLAAFFGENHGRMPNLEYPHEPVRSHRKHYPPAGFGPLDIGSPVRQAKAGTYDQVWLDRDAPGLPEDVQWSLYNAAPDDQQIDGYFGGGEPYRLEGLHPSKRVIEGRLPRMRVRALVQRRGRAPSAAEELTMVFDTVWFFPDQELGVAVYRGQTTIEDSDALDVEAVLLAYENLADSPRSPAHYHEALRLRTDRATAVLHLANEAPLVPELRAAERAAAAERHAKVQADELARRQAMLDEATAEFWTGGGMSQPANYAPPIASPPPLPVVTRESIANGEVDLMEIVAKADALAEEARRQGETRRAAAERAQADVAHVTPAAAEQIREVEARAAVPAHDLIGGAAPPSPFGIPSDVGAEQAHVLQAAISQLPALKRQTRRAAPQPIAPSVPLLPETKLHLGRKVREWHAAGQTLAGRDLAGAHLSRADFAGADLREVMFEEADLSGASFRGANLRGAVFTGARLVGADFTDADLADANFSQSRAANATFRDARLAGALAMKADWSGADFNGAALTGVIGNDVMLSGAILERVDLAHAVLVGAVANDARFIGARLYRTMLVGAQLERADFTEAALERAVLLNVRAQHSRWRSARMTRVQTGGSATFANADLRDVTARQCGWRGADLSGADLSGARFVLCDFGHCRFEGARLRGALLWRSILMLATFVDCDAEDADFFQTMARKADFRGARLRGTNRVQADFSETLMDRADAEPARVRA